ncbi:capZ-interacting protein isoform X2 [Cololabis saira]|uniref:capZ-interacting protein isoform X2 n=1 Tax=Cololabis saira TaxID=129043 RepID=UPI002AD3D2BC|nr:capZ-interacting protein isoform X2 [Cololabis saira]
MEDSPSKPSVAELAGRLKGHILPMPNSNDENSVSPSPLKLKMKNSAIIEKLQANLSLSPTALLPSSPKSPEVKLQPAPLSPTTPCSPLSPTFRPSRQSSEEEDPISFESPPEGTPLPSFNKTRARLSFKRRPPTRQHRRSAGEEVAAASGDLSPSELDVPKENGDKDQVFNNLTEEAECGNLATLKEAENTDEDFEKMEVEEMQKDPDDRGDLDQEAGGVKCAGDLEEDQQPLESPGQTDVKIEKGQDKTPVEAHHGDKDGI